MHPEMERIQNCLAAVRRHTDFVPEVAVVLGSGLGGFADMVKQTAVVPYSEIPGFPVSTAPGHAGRFVFGYVEETPVVVMQGRVHLYEGYTPHDVVLPVRLMKAMGAKMPEEEMQPLVDAWRAANPNIVAFWNALDRAARAIIRAKILFVTNASGGIRGDLTAGTLMSITDHISALIPNPLIGANIDELGVRFPDMSNAYDKGLRAILRETAKKDGIDLKEGVYIQFTGPSYESPADIRASRAMGADAVGMSTVVEVIAANHAGMRVCGVSCVANLAAGLSDRPLDGDEVIEAANAAAPKFKKLMWDSIAAMHAEEKA